MRLPRPVLVAALAVTTLTLAALPGTARAQAGGESLDEALCRLVEASARAHRLPPGFLTRLIFRESSFRTGVVSPAGAQGVAQFMPGTAKERGLLDPFDPEQAVPKAGEFLSELRDRFGNLGLAAAAYNGGPNRLARWLETGGSLPAETETYVRLVTGRPVDDWAEAARGGTALETQDGPRPCLTVTADLRQGRGGGGAVLAETAPIAPWGVQLAGNFVKARALASYGRAAQAYASLLGDSRPMVIGTRLRSRGTRAFYRVRVPAPTRSAAESLCGKIRSRGGACVVLPS